MKIVYVSPYNHGGANSGQRVRTVNICQALQDECGFEITCLSPWSVPAGIKHEYFNLDVTWPQRLVRLVSLNMRLLAKRPDIVISETPLAPLSLGLFKVVHVIHDAKFATAMGRKGSGIVRRMHWLSSRLADRVLTVSASERIRIAQALDVSEGTIVVSYNGLGSNWLAPLPNAPVPQYDLIYVSNFARHKGHARLLDAIAGCGYKILFVGADFGEREKIIRQAERLGINASFREGVSEVDLIALYDSSGIFVYPSELEGFGIPYLEARSRGLPVVAQDIPVFRELQGRVGGEIVDFDKPEAVRSALAVVSDGHRERPDLDQFSWTFLARRLMEDMLG